MFDVSRWVTLATASVIRNDTKRHTTQYSAAQACFTSRLIRRRRPEAKEWRRCSNSCQNFRVFPAFMGLDWVVVRTNDCEKIEKINKDMELNGGFQSSKIAHRPCSFQYDTHVFGESPFYIKKYLQNTDAPNVRTNKKGSSLDRVWSRTTCEIHLIF